MTIPPSHRLVASARAALAVFCAGLALQMAACGGPSKSPVPAQSVSTTDAGDATALGTWRATLALPGGELPFTLQLAKENGAIIGYLINGDEHLRVAETSFSNNVLKLRMPGFENALSASLKDGALSGELMMVKSGAKRQHIPFAAKTGEWRFFPTASVDAANVAGRWAVTFTDDDGQSYRAVGEFQQTGSEVRGTFLTPTGDHRFLAGNVRGKALYLSVFDGGHAFLYHAVLGSNGELTGDYWSGLAWHEKWTAKRDARASLGDSESVTQMRTKAGTLGFSFPDLQGQQVSLRDIRFKDKVVIVALAGSWCPNCHDEAAFLADYYRRNRTRGVEVVSLMFEQFGDMPQAVAATRRFRSEFAIEYTTLIAGISDKDDAATRVPELNKVVAFPTTLFVDRKGRVRRIHTGFSGPATGEHYRSLIAQFESTTEQLLREPAGT